MIIFKFENKHYFNCAVSFLSEKGFDHKGDIKKLTIKISNNMSHNLLVSFKRLYKASEIEPEIKKVILTIEDLRKRVGDSFAPIDSWHESGIVAHAGQYLKLIAVGHSVACFRDKHGNSFTIRDAREFHAQSLLWHRYCIQAS